MSEVSLVTGASGLMGRALVSELERHGKQVVGLGGHDVDLTNFDQTVTMFEMYRPSIVYHLAARVSGIMGNLRAQGQGFLDNLRINTNTIEAARLSGARKVVAMGTTAIYSDMVRLPMQEEEIWIGPPHQSEAGYAHAKRAMLAQLESYRDQWGMDFAYCISTNLFGPHDKFDEQSGHVLPSLISKFHRASNNRTSVTIWGTGTPQRDFLYVKDAAAAMRLIGDTFSGCINIASGRSVSIGTVVEMLREISGCPKDALVWDRTKPDGQKLRSYNVSKLRDLGFKSFYDLRSALTETYQWYSENLDFVRR